MNMTNINQTSKKFIKAIFYTLLALLIVQCGRLIALKKNIQPEGPVVNVEQTRNADEFFFMESFKDLKEELEILSQENKQAIFIFFDMQGCPYCKYMKENVLNQVSVQDYYRSHFRVISIDINALTEAADLNGTEMSEAQLAASYGVNLTPTMLFIAADGSELYRKKGFIKSVDDFLEMGKEIVEFTEIN